MNSDTLAIVVALISSGLLTTLLTQGIAIYNRRKDAKNGTASALRLILKDRIRFLCEAYIEQGWIYGDELEDLLAMHKCYHDTLKGNGYLDVLIGHVKQLDVRGIRK